MAFKQNVLILTAMRQELSSLVSFFGKQYMPEKKGIISQVKSGDSIFFFAYTGVGRKGIKKVLWKICDVLGDRVQTVIFFGCCGALDPALKKGDVIRMTKALNESGDVVEVKDFEWMPHFVSGEMLSVRSFVDKHEKHNLRKQPIFKECMAVDMELFDAAEFFKDKKYDFIALKIVSDELETNVPTNQFMHDWFFGDVKKKTLISIFHPVQFILFLTLQQSVKDVMKKMAVDMQRFLVCVE